MPKFDITPSDDKTEITIAIDGTVAATANALQLDALIHGLVAARAQLLPRVPNDPPLGEQVPVQRDPRYWTNLDAATGCTLLMLRHDGLGWLGFTLPPAERDRLAGYFTEQAKAVPAPSQAVQTPNLH